MGQPINERQAPHYAGSKDSQDEEEWLEYVKMEKVRRGLPSSKAVVLEGSFHEDQEPKLLEVDLKHPTGSQRRLILDAALQTKDMDNARLLWKIRQRLDRHVHTCMHVNHQGRPWPTAEPVIHS